LPMFGHDLGKNQMFKRSSALCAVASVCTMFTVPTQATPETEAFIQQNFDKGYMILNDTSLSHKEQRMELRGLLMELTASRRIAVFTLGSYAAGAGPAELDAFSDAFANYIAAVSEKELNRSENQTLKVTGSTDRVADDSLVRAELLTANRPNEPSVKVAFRVRTAETGAPTITDIQIEGVSLAITERDEFTAYLQQHEGNIAELSKRLKAMADMLVEKQ